MKEIGETERGLRAITCQWCGAGFPFAGSNSDGEVHLVPPRGYFRDATKEACTSKHRELLPLFNAGMAGAYAAAAKHARCVCGKCECQHPADTKWGVNGKHSIDAWREHILALTPADARQYSTSGTINFTIQNKAEISAAIASAEARARLEEHVPYCKHCMFANPDNYCPHGYKLYKAVHTPDSPKEPE